MFLSGANSVWIQVTGTLNVSLRLQAILILMLAQAIGADLGRIGVETTVEAAMLVIRVTIWRIS